MYSDQISKMHNDEGRVGHARFTKVGAVVQVLVINLPSPVLIRAFRHLEQRKNVFYTLVT